MNSPAPKTTPTTPTNSLSSQLQQIGLCALPTQLDDFIARARSRAGALIRSLNNWCKQKAPNARAGAWSAVCE